MRPLIVGEAPSKNEVTEHPIEGRVGKRLADLCGLSLPAFLNHFDRINLLHVRQDTREKGFEFDAAAARKEAWRLRMTWPQGRAVLLLGKRVARAFCIERPAYFEPWMADMNFYVLPHPSGINRWWNDPKNQLMAEQFMRQIVEQSRA